MLSRRHLRIKVLQALYALESARDANLRLAEDFIDESFKPDLNSMTPQDPLKLQGLAKIAKILLNENLKNDDIAPDDDTPSQALVTGRNALKMFQKSCSEDIQRIGKKLVPEVEQISKTYYEILKLISEISKSAKIERERVYDDPDDPISKNAGLDSNKIITALNNSQTLDNEIIRRGIDWSNDDIFVRQGYKDVLRKDETYRTYCETKNHTLAEDLEVVQYFVREILFKHEFFTSYFEQKDLFWAENGSIVRKMVAKTLQSEEIDFVPLTDAWDEDVFFMENLYKKTIENNNEYEEIIKEPLKNWELERLALSDMLILKMGISEMIHFSAIPTKVSINECIELAKEYSTPKSGKFVNGILDTLSKQLTTSGKIRKSGRGLMDNK